MTLSDLKFHYNRANFGPVGYCIYCGKRSADTKLSDEHILPYFIGGNVELLEASCSGCAGVTSFLDGHCANKIFHWIRHEHGLQTRRPKKRPQTIDISVETNAGRVARGLVVKQAPYFLFLPRYPMPGLLVNRPPEEVIVPDTLSVWTNSDVKERVEKLRQPGDKKWEFQANWNNSIFARWLAKTALAAAVAFLKFDPTSGPLPGLILGTDKRVGWLVGSDPPKQDGVTWSEHPPLFGKDVHEVGFAYWQSPVHTALVAQINLFKDHGNPITYFVVVGNAMGGLIEEHAQSPKNSF